MKKTYKIIYLMIMLLLVSPLDTLAYSEYIIPGGESIGIEIQSEGIMIVGFYKVNGKYNKGTPTLKVGDKIYAVDGVEVDSVEKLITEMEKATTKGSVDLSVSRDGKNKRIKLELGYEDGTYKTGLYVKDAITGIGTLTYIDPETGLFGALGHNIAESNTNRTVEVKTGTIFRSSVTGIDRSISGSPGGKNAKFYSQDIFGNINKNVTNGIYGKYTEDLPDKNTLKVAKPDEVEEGMATIYTVLDGEKIKEYEIEITKVEKSNSNKNIYFKVTDEELLAKTGGIVQGMSGSPIIQNDKIIGAVTHVVISNPSNGYGIYITSMLKEGERN